MASPALPTSCRACRALCTTTIPIRVATCTVTTTNPTGPTDAATQPPTSRSSTPPAARYPQTTSGVSTPPPRHHAHDAQPPQRIQQSTLEIRSAPPPEPLPVRHLRVNSGPHEPGRRLRPLPARHITPLALEPTAGPAGSRTHTCTLYRRDSSSRRAATQPVPGRWSTSSKCRNPSARTPTSTSEQPPPGDTSATPTGCPTHSGRRVGQHPPPVQRDHVALLVRFRVRDADPFPQELGSRHRIDLRRHELRLDPQPQRRVGLRPHRPVGRVATLRRRPLEVRQPFRHPSDRAPTHRMQLHRGRHRRRRRVPHLRVRPRRQGRQQRPIASGPRLYASSKITQSPENPRPDPRDRATNRSRAPERSSIPIAVRRPHPSHLLTELVRVVDQRLHPQERLSRCLELVSAVQDQPLTEQEQPCQLACLGGCCPSHSGEAPPRRPRTPPNARRNARPTPPRGRTAATDRARARQGGEFHRFTAGR